jgi:hypothetical protein
VKLVDVVAKERVATVASLRAPIATRHPNLVRSIMIS